MTEPTFIPSTFGVAAFAGRRVGFNALVNGVVLCGPKGWPRRFKTEEAAMEAAELDAFLRQS